MWSSRSADRTLFSGIHLMIKPGMRMGLVGPNGSGKTTLLRLMRGDIQPSHGKIRRADQLRIVYFDQNRELDPDISLEARSCAGRRFRCVSGSRHSRRVVGRSFPVFQ